MAGPSPGVRARLRSIVRWRALAAGRTGPDVRQHPALAAPAARGWRAVAAATDRAERVLREWEGRPVPTQPCLRDVWGAHVLFTGEAVTGLVDYGSVNDDHVGTDLARMLGDLVGDDAGRFAAGLAAYRAAGGVLDAPDEFVRVLDRTGVVGAVITWLLRLHGGTYAHPDWPAVAARLDRLAARVERNFPG